MTRPSLALVAALGLALAGCEFVGSTSRRPEPAGELSEPEAPRPEVPRPEVPGGLTGWLARLEHGVRVRTRPAPGEIAVPVQGVPRSRVADTYGAPRGEGRLHEGLDIFAPEDTPVLAAAPGMVVEVGTNRLGGLVVTVWGDGDRRYYYAHLSRYANIAEGQLVEAGDLLGFVGTTGNASTTPPHLHFGVYENGWNAVNPYPLLR